MITLVACTVAIASTVAFMILWFSMVQKELSAKQNMAKSAKLQLVSAQKKNIRAKNSHEKQISQSVLSRSEDIYKQSVENYNRSLKEVQNFIPGSLMGFRQLK
ncbi:MAG: hypothetical protein RSA20_00720 [Oscillospiraceae bacterium]